MKNLKYFSLFTGIGGLDMGLHELGAECVGFSEIKKTSIKIYQKHYPTHKCYGDITQLDFAKLPDFDVLTGGFPCQAFSLAGLKQGFGGKTGKMIFYIYDLLKAKRPKWVVLENVKGLLVHEKGKTYRNVFKLLMSAGYKVRVLLTNSLFYGSAQARERLIFICHRDEDFPRVQLEVVDDSKRFRDIRDRDASHFHFVDMNKERNIAKIDQRDLYPFCLVGGYDRVLTLTTAVSGGGGRNPSLQQKIVEEDGQFRYLTELEAERLQGFPDGWTEGIGKSMRWFALGNAVNCDVSRYLFKDYLKKLWWSEKV